MSIANDYVQPSSSGKIKQPKISEEALSEDSHAYSAREVQLGEQVVSIPLILKKILERLPKRQLLKTALVCKSWNLLSREVLRAVCSSLATLNVIMCGDLTYLDTFLRESYNIPFNGLCLTITDCECVKSNSSTAWSAPVLLYRVNIRYLTVEFETPKTKSCVSLAFLRTLLTHRARALVSFGLKRVPEIATTLSQIIGMDLQKICLPNLRVLKFPTCDLLNSTCKPMPKSFVEELVKASPRLRKLYGTIVTSCLEFLLPSKLHKLLEDFNFQPLLDPLDLVTQFGLEEPQLKRLRFSTRINEGTAPMFHEWEESDVEKVAQILRLLLSSSEGSLRSLCVDNLDLLLITRKWDMPVLKHVQKLHLQEVSGYMHNNEGFQSLRKLEWSKYFPNLKEVWVTQTCSMENYDTDFYMGREMEESNVQYKCETVKKFVVAQNSYTQLAPLINFGSLRSLFPNAKELYVDHGIQSFRMFGNLLTGWPDLEVYVCKFEKLDSIFNYDDYFMGVGKEEARYLLRHVEELDALEIVPKHPCLLHFPKLKKLEIHLKHNRSSCNESAPRRNVMFVSRLTAICIFSRMPDLTVEIHRAVCTAAMGCHLTLGHLKPFVSLVDRDEEYFY